MPEIPNNIGKPTQNRSSDNTEIKSGSYNDKQDYTQLNKSLFDEFGVQNHNSDVLKSIYDNDDFKNANLFLKEIALDSNNESASIKNSHSKAQAPQKTANGFFTSIFNLDNS